MDFNNLLYRRISCVPLDNCVTGLTVIFSGGYIYGLHAHREGVSDTLNYPKVHYRLRELVWLYFPLGKAEEIQAIWICSKKDRSSYAFMVGLCLFALYFNWLPVGSNLQQIRTSHDRTYKFGEYMADHHCTIQCLSYGPVKYLLHEDPEPGEPILGLGASGHTKEYNVDKPKYPTTIEYPFFSLAIYYSQASLEGVCRVECFLDSIYLGEINRPCIGLILEYANGRQEVLGECRIGISQTVHINAPSMLHLKPGHSEGFHSRVWFTTSTSEAQALHSRGWHGGRMCGMLTLWFGNRVIEIVHSWDMAEA